MSTYYFEDYLVVEGYEVPKYLKEGWDLYGPPMMDSCYPREGLKEWRFFQAMTKCTSCTTKMTEIIKE